MTNKQLTNRQQLTFQRAIVPLTMGLLLALALALLLAITWLNAPGRDIADLVQYLLTSGAISLVLGLGGLAWLRRGYGPIWLQVTLTYALGIIIAFFNVYLTAQLMFFNQDHDLQLLVLLLLFAAVVSITLGATLARALAQRVSALHQGAHALAQGNLTARVQTNGSDELTALAHEFNQMADQLAAGVAERERLELARRELIAAVSHDLRTPLTSLRAMTEALTDGLVEEPEMAKRYLTTMRSQINHLSRLIDDLFELAQIDAGALKLELQRVSPNDLVSDAIEGMRPQAATKGVALQGHIAPDVGQLLVAPQKIERVLYNLVTNAIRHTPSDGVVSISVASAVKGEKSAQSDAKGYKVNVSGEAAPSFIIFEIADTGEGIAPDDLPHVFDRFYRGEKSRSRATGGAGLGLAIARGIIEAHGGAIWIESLRERGTCVRFTLPQVG
jgi:signal transduction histidine kinase